MEAQGRGDTGVMQNPEFLNVAMPSNAAAQAGGERLQRAIAVIDAVNAQDPNCGTWNGQSVPAALLYSWQMTTWLTRLLPDPGELHHIAARAQHIGRWRVPRSDYPATRAGYLAWRSGLYTYHADHAAQIMTEIGYPADAVECVKRMLAKRGLKQDPDVQLIEDLACLVFLEHYFVPFAATQGDDKIIDIVRKTWRKMSESAQQAALGLALPERLADLVHQALQS